MERYQEVMVALSESVMKNREIVKFLLSTGYDVIVSPPPGALQAIF